MIPELLVAKGPRDSKAIKIVLGKDHTAVLKRALSQEDEDDLRNLLITSVAYPSKYS